MSKINIDFDVFDNKNPYFFSIIDQSSWGLLKDNTATVEILKPGYSKAITKFFDKRSVNTYNSFTLDINCIETCEDSCYEAIPDGIYCITVKSTCEKYSATKKFLRTTLLELELDKLIISSITCDKKDSSIDSKLTEIEFLIKAAKANVRYDNINEAKQLFEKAEKVINKAKNCNE